MTTPTPAAGGTPPPELLLRTLQRHCLLVSLTFHRWGGQPMVRGASIGIGPVSLGQQQVTPPRWRLMPPEFKETIDGLESRARASLDRISVPFFIKGVHIVPLSRARELFEELRKIRGELDAAIKKFVWRGYGGVIGEIRKQLGGAAFARASSLIPDKRTMAKRFGVTWAVVPLETGKPPARLSEAAAADYIAEARAQLSEMVERSLEAMIRQPREELAEAVGNLADLLDRRGVRQGTLDAVRRTFEKLRGFQFLADKDLLVQMRAVEKRLGSLAPRDLNDKAQREVAIGLSKVLRELKDSAGDEAAIREVGRPWRVFQL